MEQLTGVVGLEGVDNAFTALGDPEKHAKINQSYSWLTGASLYAAHAARFDGEIS